MLHFLTGLYYNFINPLLCRVFADRVTYNSRTTLHMHVHVDLEMIQHEEILQCRKQLNNFDRHKE